MDSIKPGHDADRSVSPSHGLLGHPPQQIAADVTLPGLLDRNGYRTFGAGPERSWEDGDLYSWFDAFRVTDRAVGVIDLVRQAARSERPSYIHVEIEQLHRPYIDSLEVPARYRDPAYDGGLERFTGPDGTLLNRATKAVYRNDSGT